MDTQIQPHGHDNIVSLLVLMNKNSMPKVQISLLNLDLMFTELVCMLNIP
jgi:hypothetical protein